MNKKRRETISKNINLLENIKTNLEDILSEEELCFDSMPENLQSSIRGEESENAINTLSEVIESLGDCIESLNDII